MVIAYGVMLSEPDHVYGHGLRLWRIVRFEDDVPAWSCIANDQITGLMTARLLQEIADRRLQKGS